MGKRRTLSVWAQGDAHVGRDKKYGRDSLAEALIQSESGDEQGAPPFHWDFAINVGDYCGDVGVPTDEEGEEVVRQFGVLKKHRREQIYSVSGNHDRSGLDRPEGEWFRRYVDPMGENPAISGVDAARYPHPIEGTWERYAFETGNIRFLMMSDVNERSHTKGRGDLGGNPGGVVTAETFKWWQDQVDRNRDKIIVSVHHYMLKDTTLASGLWEGMKKDADGKWEQDYHGYFPEGSPAGASFLCWVGGEFDSGKFESHLSANPGAVDLWLGGHSHDNPDGQKGGKTSFEQAHGGTTFMNICPLTRHVVPNHAIPHSWLLTFTDGSDELLARCYMHTDEYRPRGWYDAAERRIKLSGPVRL